MEKLTPKDAWLYAAQWGSYMHGGDPGACMYGFDEHFRVQSEGHRRDCLRWIEQCRQDVIDSPADYDPDELDKLAQLEAAVRDAPCEKE